jgi:ribose 5-phosphate isomerase RpiB
LFNKFDMDRAGLGMKVGMAKVPGITASDANAQPDARTSSFQSPAGSLG